MWWIVEETPDIYDRGCDTVLPDKEFDTIQGAVMSMKQWWNDDYKAKTEEI
jgi:hypothetical protein